MTTHEIDHSRPAEGVPWVPRHYVRRERFWQLLDEATEHPVTMVVAPAGAGKTMGLAGWLGERPAAYRPVWCTASAETTPAELDGVLERAAGPGGPPSLVIVDDAHLLPAATVRLLGERLGSEPASLRLVLLTRWDLPIPRLVPQLLGHLTVLRGDVLRLSGQESWWLASQHAPRASDEVISAIVDRAGGWCAALVLAARASATMPAPADVAGIFRTSSGSLADLVAGEVFVGLRPQERHLLLCIAGEKDLTEEVARHLTMDPRAGEVLANLEAIGLLVCKVSRGSGSETLYQVHPLLQEVVRRRLVVGGVDVQRAHGTVLRAARSDLGQGLIADAVSRFLAAGAVEEAAAVVADHGVRLAVSGEQRTVQAFARDAEAVLADHPETWPVLARAGWAAGDSECARHWADRALAHEHAHPGTIDPLQKHDLLLRRWREGADDPSPLVESALAELDRSRERRRDPYVALVQMEVGVAESWMGRLTAAEEHLSAAVQTAHAHGLTAVAAEATSHLALTQLMLGHDQACLHLAVDVLDTPRVASTTRSRAELARMLVWFSSFPQTPPAPDSGSPGDPEAIDPTTWVLPPHLDDPTGEFWRRLMRARLALLGGSVPDALRGIEALPPRGALPAHLRVSALMEEAGLAVISSNRTVLRSLAEPLAECGATAEALWVRGAAEDIAGDLRSALHLYSAAAEGTRRAQPPTAAVALACAAQVSHSLGQSELAEDLLVQALDATSQQRVGTPFLGWSRHGTRTGELLATVRSVDDSAWGVELRAACMDLPGIAALYAPVLATEREVATVASAHPAPSLSPREREVLLELARGSTYGDAARNLFVSENTVKTHVSSLYSKLSVSRRSEALAVARTLHLI